MPVDIVNQTRDVLVAVKWSLKGVWWKGQAFPKSTQIITDFMKMNKFLATWKVSCGGCEVLHFNVSKPVRLAARKKIVKINDNCLAYTVLAFSRALSEKVFVEQNENKLINISLQKKSVKPIRFNDISMSV